MHALSADLLFVCNESFDIIPDGAIVYDQDIIDIDTIENIQKRHPDLTIIHKPESFILPGLINSHVHLEYSAHRCELDYGSYIGWLFSVIKHRDMLSERCDSACMDQALHAMLTSGITTIGAISSFGLDITPCVNSPVKTVYFNEAIGSNPAAIDTLFEDFQARYTHSVSESSAHFIPAISIHSPYSIHPIYTRRILEIARKDNRVVSTHFLESPEEKEWLESSSGPFLEFFQGLFKTGSSLITPKDFLVQFEGLQTLFTHVVYADEVELQIIKDIGGAIQHCPRSNRLLSGHTLDMEKVMEKGIPLLPATDGLSSNDSLNLFDELKSALLMHQNVPLESCAKALLLGATLHGAKALNLPTGSLQKGRAADFIIASLPSGMETSTTPAADAILHTRTPNEVYINGVQHL